MEVIEKRQQPDDATFFDEQVRLAQNHHDRGLDLCYARPKDVDGALCELDTAIRMRESLFGKYHSDTALSYFRKACILKQDKKDYFSAIVVARRELRISQDLPEEMNNGRDWLSERIEWIQEALSLHHSHKSERDLAKYSSQLLQRLECERLGDRHYARKEWDLAITHFGSALVLESSAYARNSLEIADIQVKIGDCYAGMKDFDAAMEEYKNAEGKYLCELGPSPHSIIGHLLNKRAALHLMQKEFDAALGAYAKAFSIFEEVLGKHHALAFEALQDIRLVTVKEMEDLRNIEWQRKKETSRARRDHDRAEIDGTLGFSHHF